ncbi:MAG: hypothetical protein IIA67_08205, partial [Planctomycetes bacterium]|nr:hypothetical protein [Planctomycetota bacterium]
VGLAYLPAVWHGREVVIHGPAPPFAEATPDEALGRLLHAPFSAPLAVYPFTVKLVPVNKTAMTVSGLDMSFRGQSPMFGSMGTVEACHSNPTPHQTANVASLCQPGLILFLLTHDAYLDGHITPPVLSRDPAAFGTVSDEWHVVALKSTGAWPKSSRCARCSSKSTTQCRPGFRRRRKRKEQSRLCFSTTKPTQSRRGESVMLKH